MADLPGIRDDNGAIHPAQHPKFSFDAGTGIPCREMMRNCKKKYEKEKAPAFSEESTLGLDLMIALETVDHSGQGTDGQHQIVGEEPP